MKVMVTGAAGFIGSHTVNQLLKLGYDVVGVDNFDNYYSAKIKEYNISRFVDNPKLNFYNTDIREYNKLKKIFESTKPDKICHLAAKVGVRPSIANPIEYEDVNIKGTLNLLNLSKDFGLRNFVYASSSSVYGNNKKIPFREDDVTNEPISPYAATKRAIELLAFTYHHLYNLNCTGLRFFTVYGPSGRPDMAPFLFTKWIHEGLPIKRFGTGTSKRDYTYISDIVNGIISAIEKDYPYEIFNLGNSSPVSLNRFIEIIEGILGKQSKIEENPSQLGDVSITYADISKARKMLNYRPRIKIEDGMKIFVNWFLQNEDKYS